MGFKDKLQFKIKNSVLLKYRGSDEEVTIPAGVRTVKEAFCGNKTLKRVRIPAGVILVELSFTECPQLEEVIFEGGKVIVDRAFIGCTNLKSIVISKEVLKLKFVSAFANCTSLTRVDLPESVWWIEGAFARCTALIDVRLPADLTKINRSAFLGCTALAHIDIPESVVEIEDSAFEGCSNLSDLHLPPHLKAICSYAFKGCAKLKGVSVPTNVELGIDSFDLEAISHDEALIQRVEAASQIGVAKANEYLAKLKESRERRRQAERTMATGTIDGIPICRSCGGKLAGYVGINSEQAARAREGRCPWCGATMPFGVRVGLK